LQLLSPALQRGAKSLVVERLYQVIERLYFESLERVLIVGGDEDDRRTTPHARTAQHFERIAFGQVDIEEQQVGLQVADGLHRGVAVAAFAHDLDIAVRGQ